MNTSLLNAAYPFAREDTRQGMFPILRQELGRHPLSLARLAALATGRGYRPAEIGVLLEAVEREERLGREVSPEEVWQDGAMKLVKVMYAGVEDGLTREDPLQFLPGDWASTLHSHDSVMPSAWRVFVAAIAAQENTARGRVSAAAPTLGASGVLPGVLWAMSKATGASAEVQVEALFASGLVGLVAFGRGPVSGAQAGCGGEIGIAAAMAAGAATTMLGGDWDALASAAALAAAPFVGLECSPSFGLVEYPCVPRNGFAALCAVAAAEAACAGIVPPYDADETLDRIFGVGALLPERLRETEDGHWMAIVAPATAGGHCGCASKGESRCGM